MEGEWRSAMQKRLQRLRQSAMRRTNAPTPSLSHGNDSKQERELLRQQPEHSSDDAKIPAAVKSAPLGANAAVDSDSHASAGASAQDDKYKKNLQNENVPGTAKLDAPARVVHVHRSGSITVTGVRLHWRLKYFSVILTLTPRKGWGSGTFSQQGHRFYYGSGSRWRRRRQG